MRNLKDLKNTLKRLDKTSNMLFFFKLNDLISFTLPAFINEVYHQCTENKENEQGNKHVVDRPDVVHLKQLTAKKQIAGD